MRNIYIILIFVLVIGLLLFKYTYTKGTDYVLISNDSTALIIDNWFGIRKIKSLFNLNYHDYDCCSSTGNAIYFIQSPKRFYTVTRETENLYLYNNKKINKTLLELVDNAKKHPNYTLYSLTIPINQDLDSVISVLINDKFKILVPFDYENQLPTMVIERRLSNINPDYSYVMMQQIEDTLRLLTNNFRIAKLGGFVSEGELTSINRNTFTFQYELIFQDNSMLNSFLNKVDTSIFKVKNIRYMYKRQLWLLSKESNISTVMITLFNRYEFIEDIKYK